MLATGREIVGDLLLGAAESNLVGRLAHVQGLGGALIVQSHDGAEDKGGSLARREAVYDRRHAPLLELPKEEIAARLGEGAHYVCAGGLGTQGVVEDIKADLGLAS